MLFVYNVLSSKTGRLGIHGNFVKVLQSLEVLAFRSLCSCPFISCWTVIFNGLFIIVFILYLSYFCLYCFSLYCLLYCFQLSMYLFIDQWFLFIYFGYFLLFYLLSFYTLTLFLFSILSTLCRCLLY